MMKKLVCMIVALAVTLSLTSVAFAAETAAGTEKAARVSVPQEIKDKKEQLVKLYQEARSLREKLQSTKGVIRDGLAAIKDTFEGLNEEEKAEAKVVLKALREGLKSDRAEVKAVRSELVSMTERMRAFRTELKAAMAAKDYTKAATLLDNMIQLKGEKNAKLKQLVELRDRMLDKVKK